MPHPKLLSMTCYIRTLNEERRIAEVVQRAGELCDQVLVIDSGSTDRTVEAALASGAEVVHQEWLGNGHQKRVGEDQAKNDWLLDLDADEVLSPQLMDEIRGLFLDGQPGCSVYRLALTIVDPTGRIWRRSGVSYRAKLYDRRVIRMPAERAWDQLAIPASVRIGRLKSPLYHHAFTDIGHLVRKQESAMRNRVSGMPPRPHLEICLRVAGAFPFYFLKYYLLRGLWRVGVYGICFSLVCAFSRWGRDVKLYERDWLRGTGATKNPAPSVSARPAAENKAA